MNDRVIIRDTTHAGRSMFALRDFSVGDVAGPARSVSRRSAGDPICLLADRVLADGAEAARRLISMFPCASTSPLERSPSIEGFLRSRIPEHPDVPIAALLRAIVCLNLKTPNADGVYGIYDTLSYVNHGCLNNAVLSSSTRTDPEVLRMVAVQPIAAGEEITVSYLVVFSDGRLEPLAATLPSFEVRREFLRQEYGFECRCAVCRSSDGEPRQLSTWLPVLLSTPAPDQQTPVCTCPPLRPTPSTPADGCFLGRPGGSWWSRDWA